MNNLGDMNPEEEVWSNALIEINTVFQIIYFLMIICHSNVETNNSPYTIFNNSLMNRYHPYTWVVFTMRQVPKAWITVEYKYVNRKEEMFWCYVIYAFFVPKY